MFTSFCHDVFLAEIKCDVKTINAIVTTTFQKAGFISRQCAGKFGFFKELFDLWAKSVGGQLFGSERSIRKKVQIADILLFSVDQ